MMNISTLNPKCFVRTLREDTMRPYLKHPDISIASSLDYWASDQVLTDICL